ncbi:type II toxin-antitoxin system VapC family toxin [Nostoc sp. 'Peltigera membranacea cyanobiont' 232]|uniref:type II toxin-antitoxin system VapC family toxin n=1 Tax=Nostoc sp. 'Peltigera membranacea cyanobiont' 232 TaxID=2014531 RepID=UPI000B957CF9|nr:type II toxin-antitoxin system VapC family toxin [Nostoc sp. 'Peltigera membranacea cyanobiont' 232]OYE06440.1 PIN domain nuclease [Nostoc sp. 'Peltigera membranacea cyanobiont' 232]
MIVLDTHIWVWWVQNDSRLTQKQQQWLQDYESDGLGISILSCWEVAKLVEEKRLVLPVDIDKWLEAALAYPGVQLLNLSLPIIVDSTQLNGFHSDPFDQMIVATARFYNCLLLTADAKILNYPDVQMLK